MYVKDAEFISLIYELSKDVWLEALDTQVANSFSRSDERRKRLKIIFENKAFLKRSPSEKPFKLASGGSSYVFFDCKLVTQDPEGIALIAELIFDRVSKFDIDAIGGIQTGAIPIGTAVVSQLHPE